ncbi:MFS transporter [Micromonosporaceae bacterium Da 78-11]
MTDKSHRPVAVIAVLMVGALLAVSQLYLTVPLLPAISDRYDVGPSAAVWSGGGFGLAFALGNLVFGTASDRYDRRTVMAIGLFASGLAGVAAGLSPNYPALLAARIVEGFFAAAFAAVALAHIADVLEPRRRAAAIAAVSSCFLLAGITGQAYALGVENTLGWHWVFWLLAAPLAVCAVVVRRLPAPPARDSAPPQLSEAFVRLARLLGNPLVRRAYLCACTILLAFVAMYTALNVAVAHRYDITATADLLLLRLGGLPGIVVGVFAGGLVVRFGPHRVGALAFLLAAVGLLVEATAGPLWLLIVGSGMFVAGIAVAVPAVVAVVGQASGVARGAGVAGYGFLVGIGAGVAPLLVAAMADAGFPALCLLLAAILLVSATSIGLPAPKNATPPRNATPSLVDAHLTGSKPAPAAMAREVDA